MPATCCVMAEERFARELIERVIAAYDPITLARGANTSVLGSINSKTMSIRLRLERAEVLERPGLSELHRHVATCR